MQQLLDAAVAQFQSQHQYEKFVKQSDKEYDIKIYRLQSFSLSYACEVYQDLQEKYNNDLLSELPQGWHQNERRLFVWFILCFIRLKLLDPIKFIDAEKYYRYWNNISRAFWGKDPAFLKYQLLNIIKTRGRTSWKKQEEKLLIEAYSKFQKGQWNEVAKYFYIQSRGAFFKTPKQCRERWQNHLNSNIKHGEWTNHEDKVLFQFVQKKGQKWATIIPLLNNQRTEHMIKNRFKSVTNKIMNDHNVSQKEAIDLYLRKIGTVEDDRDERGILQVQSEELIQQPDQLPQKQVRKRGRPRKNANEQGSQNLSKNESLKKQNSSDFVKSNQISGCILEGTSFNKNQLFFNHSYNNFDNSRGFFDSIHSNHSGLFQSSGRLSGQGFTIPCDFKSLDKAIFPEAESLRINKIDSELDGFLQRQSIRSRKPSGLYPNDSYISGYMK